MTQRFVSALARVALGLVALAFVGCHRGADLSSVSGSWTVDGAAASTASCAAVGIDTVRLAIYAPSGAAYVDHIDGPCAAGSIDTRPNGVLAPGDYDVAWEGFVGGVRSAAGTRHPVTAFAGGHLSVPPVDFVSAAALDPRGTDASVSAHWTVEHAVPTSASCAALGIARVRVAFYDGATVVEIAALTSACDGGVIDTRPARVLRAGHYTVQFQALSSAGIVLGTGAMASVDASVGGHLALYGDAPVDFSSTPVAFDPIGVDATVSYAWTLDGRAPTLESCYAVGASEVHMVMFAADDTAFAHGVSIAQAACRDGAFDSRPTSVLRAGRYLVSIEARDDAGLVVQTSAPTLDPFDVPSGAHVDVPAVDLVFATTLTFAIDWATPGGSIAANCVAAGVDSFSYALVDDATGVMLGRRDAVACSGRVSFEESVTPGFGAGTYSLFLAGAITDGTLHWRPMAGSCSAVTVASGSIAFDQCLAEHY